MSHFYILFINLIFLFSSAYTQKKWDGGGGNNAWNNAFNWVGNVAPGSTDDVVLDNSIITGNYAVVLPATAVVVRTVTIIPALNRTIELSLPSVNTLAPGFTANGPGYGMIINTGGVFRNASGATAGVGVRIADSIRINNDGKYIHNTSGGHATNVQVLSSSPGTEAGIFEFDILSASSTISFSGRIFGRLSMKSTAAGGTCNYTAAGTSRVIIRNNLEIGAGANLNLNFSDTIFVLGNFSQEAGTFNVGNAPRSVVIFVKQNFTQAVGGIITETGTGIQTILLNSDNVQLMSVRGSWLNQVALVKTGMGSILLKTPLLLPYKLALRSGKLISSSDWLLTLQQLCTLDSDSLSDQGYVTGPMKKEGLSNSSFLFPVGDGNVKRWLRLENATGTFTVEHFKVNPQTLSSSLGNGLHHISTIEYWDVTGTAGASAVVKLSFNDPHSGGVTDLSALRVARLNFSTWQNAGNTIYSGSPGSNGWVSSASASGFSANAKSFALASAIGQENPLPLLNAYFKAVLIQSKMNFQWKVNDSEFATYIFEVQQSDDGKNFATCFSVDGNEGQNTYNYEVPAEHIARYYRLRLRGKEVDLWYHSNIVVIPTPANQSVTFPAGNIVGHTLQVMINSEVQNKCVINVVDVQGRKVHTRSAQLLPGRSVLNVNVESLRPGTYYLQISSGMRRYSGIFTKR